MKVIRNKILPFGRNYLAINLFGVVFAKGELSAVSQNHEYIHTLQQRELLWIGFYLLYVVEWLLRLAYYRNWMKAYYCISFEQEAYLHQRDLRYAEKRRFCAWRYFLR